MKKILLRVLVAVLITAMLTSVLASCRRAPTSNFVPPEFVFVPEFVRLPDGVNDMRNIVYADNKLLFVSNVMVNEDTWETTPKFFSMNLDGTNMTELAGYTPLSHPDPTAEGSSHIISLSVDNDGNLWIFESGYFYRDNTPADFDGEEWERWQFREELGELTAVRKLDSNGFEILTIDTSHVAPPGADFFHIMTTAIDATGNIYMGVYFNTQAGDNYEIVVLGNDGTIRTRIQMDDWIQQLFPMPDGTVAFSGWMQGPDGHSQQVRSIDINTGTLGDPLDLPQNAWRMFPGNDEYTVLFQQSNDSLFGLDAETGEGVKLISWIEVGVMADGLENILLLPDGRILVTNRTWGNTGSWNDSSFELIFLTKTPYSELPERIVLTLAAAWLSWELRAPIIEFNKTNQRYRIHVIDYSEFNTEDDWGAGLRRLTTDIIAGNIPDILDLNGLPFHQYVARGLLEDIYPLIDADPMLNRSDFIQNVLRVAETDGNLYRIFPHFWITTLIGHPSVVGPNMGWNMDEFLAVLAANPQADMPMGMWLTKMNFLTNAVFFSLDEYVNWETGNVYFDTGGFAQLLEIADRFPAEFDWNDWDDSGMGWIGGDELISTGRQIIEWASLGGFQDIKRYFGTFGGDIVFKGFPTESRNGNSFSLGTSLAITTSCVSKDGAWEFLRSFLTADWQRDNITWQFPVNQTVFDEMVVEAMTEREEPEWDDWGPRRMPTIPGFDQDGPLTQAQVNQVLALIDSVTNITDWNSSLMEIIEEGASDFFNGRGSAQDAARIIQSRASILVAEQR